MEHVGDVGHVEGRFSSLEDGVNLGVMCTVCVECTMGMEIVIGIPDGTPIMWVKCKLVSVCLVIVLISTQDRYTVYAKCTKG
jgi:hypothetical protein